MSAWIFSRANVSRETCVRAANSSGPKLFDSGRSMASRRARLDLGQNQGQRRRSHAVDARGLAEGSRFEGRQFQPALRGKPNHRVIVEVPRQRQRFIAPEGDDIRLLAI